MCCQKARLHIKHKVTNTICSLRISTATENNKFETEKTNIRIIKLYAIFVTVCCYSFLPSLYRLDESFIGILFRYMQLGWFIMSHDPTLESVIDCTQINAQLITNFVRLIWFVIVLVIVVSYWVWVALKFYMIRLLVLAHFTRFLGKWPKWIEF